MAQGSFAAQVSAWVRETKERTVAVRNEATQRVVEIMQTPVGRGGNMPVDTGFLRASLMAAVGDANFTLRANPNPDAEHGALDTFDMGQVSLVISAASITDKITAVYTANYARHQEYGANGRPGRRFVGLAAQQWPRIVAEVARDAQARAGK